MSSTEKKTAEQLFREAFERLKNNKTEVMPEETRITQNNVAREAGRDPSALKKDRYPFLVLEIQAYIKLKCERSVSNKRTNDNRSRTFKKKLKDCQKQRDKLSSIVAAQNTYIEDLLDEVETLKSAKVVKM